MYDVGQGSNIKDKPQVFEIDMADTIADTICPCGDSCSQAYNGIKTDKHAVPVQYPLGYFDKDKDTQEDYIDTSQHTKAGEPSDVILLAVSIILVCLAIWFMLAKK